MWLLTSQSPVHVLSDFGFRISDLGYLKNGYLISDFGYLISDFGYLQSSGFQKRIFKIQISDILYVVIIYPKSGF